MRPLRSFRPFPNAATAASASPSPAGACSGERRSVKSPSASPAGRSRRKVSPGTSSASTGSAKGSSAAARPVRGTTSARSASRRRQAQGSKSGAARRSLRRASRWLMRPKPSIGWKSARSAIAASASSSRAKSRAKRPVSAPGGGSNARTATNGSPAKRGNVSPSSNAFARTVRRTSFVSAPGTSGARTTAPRSPNAARTGGPNGERAASGAARAARLASGSATRSSIVSASSSGRHGTARQIRRTPGCGGDAAAPAVESFVSAFSAPSA